MKHRRIFARVICLICAALMALSFVACNTDKEPETTYPVLTFTGYSTALSFETGSDITDDMLLQQVKVSSDDGKTYTAAVKDRSALKPSEAGEYTVVIGAKDENGAWAKKSDTEEYAVNRTIRITRPTGINADKFADLEAVAMQKQDFSEGAGIYAAERAAYDADEKGMVLPSDSYIYAKMTFPAYATRYPVLTGEDENAFPNLQKNSSYYIRIDGGENKDEALLQVFLYDANGEAYDLTEAGIVPKGEKFELLVPDSLLGQDLTVVVFNAVEASEECNYTVKAIDIVQEDDPKDRDTLFANAFEYATALNVREKFQFRSAGYQGWRGISRYDVAPGWCASTDSFGLNLRYNGHPEEGETFTNAGFSGVGAWAKADIRDDVKQIKVEAGYVGGEVAMRVSLYNENGYTVLTQSDDTLDPQYCAAGDGWMRVTQDFSNQRVYSFKLPDGFAGTQPIVIIESKKLSATAGSEIRIGSVEFSTQDYVEANYIDGVDMSDISTMDALTDKEVDLTASPSSFKAKRNAQLNSGEGIVLSAATYVEGQAYHAIAAAKVTVPEDCANFKVSLKDEAGKTASFGVIAFDFKSYITTELVPMRRISGSAEVSLHCDKFPTTFTGEVGLMFVMSHEDILEADTYGSITVTGFEFFNADKISEGAGMDFSKDILQSVPIVEIGENTFNSNFDNKNIFNQWSYLNRSAGSNWAAAANAGALEMKADKDMESDWQSAAYIGTQITADYVRLDLSAYVFAEDGKTSASIRVVVYDRAADTFTVLDGDQNNGFKTSVAAFPSHSGVFYTVPEALQNKDVVMILQVAHGSGDAWSIMVYGVSFTDTAE